VAQTDRYNGDGSNVKVWCTGRFVANSGHDIRISHREVGLRHNPGKHGFNVLLSKRASLHLDFASRKINGFEKGETHEVIPVCMGEDDVALVTALFDHLVSEPSNTGPCIHDDETIVFCPDFQACGIAAVLRT